VRVHSVPRMRSGKVRPVTTAAHSLLSRTLTRSPGQFAGPRRFVGPARSSWRATRSSPAAPLRRYLH
jgi:hypothetical protein